MKILKPEFYSSFKCTGSDCREHCCQDWNIHIDKESFIKYGKIKGEFGSYLNGRITRNRKETYELIYAKINLEDRKCPFLDAKNLCNIYINLGEEYLSNTCKLYPRTIVRYYDRCERRLSLSCPEVVEKLLASQEPLSFLMEEEELSVLDYRNSVQTQYDMQMHDMIWETRALLIDIAQFREIALWKRLLFIKLVEGKVQKVIEEKKYSDFTSVIKEVKSFIQRSDVNEELDKIEPSTERKNLFVKAVLQARTSVSVVNKGFNVCIDDINTFTQKIADEGVMIEKIEREFDTYFTDRKYLLEHFIVYSLYTNVMNVIWTSNLNKEIMNLIINYAVIKQMLIAKWYCNQKRLAFDEIVEIVYSFSRVVEHHTDFIDEIYRQCKEDGYNTLAAVAILAR
ncbi:flagellin lysine-N-methylase [Cellulosilyticum lentocellum]|uniref:FliB family protein n=1 Tax=Cellulosilyticum lentocellum (strain ATCC 49066 / DSM 5427 / NCIMB 11756 / RHM5) TaxID=642492 RepID=F2JT33_CELLD|nr:flagellin lysine-N-methylase [Cellulosilyticum lentocellum]ADZ85252.1 hypothetical protein Clole_3569 [Cellulosilyticum lentocellum DSM 5427]